MLKQLFHGQTLSRWSGGGGGVPWRRAGVQTGHGLVFLLAEHHILRRTFRKRIIVQTMTSARPPPPPPPPSVFIYWSFFFLFMEKRWWFHYNLWLQMQKCRNPWTWCFKRSQTKNQFVLFNSLWALSFLRTPQCFLTEQYWWLQPGFLTNTHRSTRSESASDFLLKSQWTQKKKRVLICRKHKKKSRQAKQTWQMEHKCGGKVCSSIPSMLRFFSTIQIHFPSALGAVLMFSRPRLIFFA